MATLTTGKSEADRVLDKAKFDTSVFRIFRQAWLNFFRKEKANILQANCQPLLSLLNGNILARSITELKGACFAGETKFF